MNEPEPMKQVHDIQEKIYAKTKDMSDDDLLEYFHNESKQFEKEMKAVKPAKDLKAFFADIDKKQQAG